MIERLELAHLRTLGALYALGHMSIAAESLGVSQQAVSLQLRRIREIVGDEMFVRTGHGMVPTAYAQQIRAQVEQVLALVRAIPAPGTAALEGTTATLHISATDYTQQIIVGELIVALREHAPGVRVLVSNIEGAGLLRKMQQGEIGLAFTSSGYVPEGLVSVPLFTERYVCVSARPLPPTGEVLPLEQLVRQGFVVVSPGTPGLAGSASPWFAQQGLQRNVVISVPSFFMALQYLRRAPGLVGFVPARLMPCEGLVEVRLPKYPPGYQVVVAHHPAATGDALLAWVLQWARQRFAAGCASPGL